MIAVFVAIGLLLTASCGFAAPIDKRDGFVKGDKAFKHPLHPWIDDMVSEALKNDKDSMRRLYQIRESLHLGWPF